MILLFCSSFNYMNLFTSSVDASIFMYGGNTIYYSYCLDGNKI